MKCSYMISVLMGKSNHLFFLHLICRSHGWRIDTDEQDAHEMLNVLLTSLEEEAQKSSETVASKTASLAFYDDIIGSTKQGWVGICG